MLIDRGFQPGSAAFAASLLGISLIVGRVFVGHLMDRFFAPRVALVFLSGLVVGLALFAWGVSGFMVYFCAILVGLAIGAEFDVIAFFISRYFGPRSFGQIYGIMFGVFQFGSAIGPLAMGIGFDRTGSYSQVLWVMSGITIIAILMIAFLGPYPDLEEQPAQT
jgi:predicted MFS family arabinose efflux permease